MIEQIDITGFRGIKRFKEPIDLSKLTILLGRNNAGKSSIMEALYVLFGGYDPLLSGQKAQRVRDLHSSALSYRYSGDGVINFTGNGMDGRTEFNESSVRQVQIGSYSDNSADLNRLQRLGFDVEHPNHSTFLFSPSYESYRKFLNELQKKRGGLEKANLHQKAAEFINECIGDEYTEIYLETLEMRKKPENGAPFWVETTDLGSGVLKALTIFLTVEHIEPGILLWDDMETSLHPSLLRHLLKWITEKDIQIIASTHSIDVLSALLDVQPEDASVVQVAKSEDDVVRHEVLDMDELKLVMENAGLDPRFLSDGFEL